MKKCFKCGEEKSLHEFYKHPSMRDGYLNKCKECTKKDSDAREKYLRANNPEWVKKEKERARGKYSRLGYKDKQKQWDINKPWKSTSEYKNLHQKLKTANMLSGGETIHHWDYNDLKSYFILDKKVHRRFHVFLIFDEETRMFRDVRGRLLDTKEKHSAYLNKLISNGSIPF